MSGVVKRGLLAGAAGTALLNATTYLDIALRGRDESETPGKTIDVLLDKLGRSLPGGQEQQESRRRALGALAGIASGLGIGVVASAARAAGTRLPGPLGSVATGAAAMAATNAPMALAGISDPRAWSASDWISDAVPHLAYGTGAQAVIRAQPEPDSCAPSPSIALVLRSLTLGVATGARSSLGLAAPGLLGSKSTVGTVGKVGRALGIGGELVADKLPQTPSRLQPPALAGRIAGGAAGGRSLAASAGAAPAYPLAAGAVGAVLGSYAGAAWRRWAAARWPDWQGALIEDGTGLLLAFVACRPG